MSEYYQLEDPYEVLKQDAERFGYDFEEAQHDSVKDMDYRMMQRAVNSLDLGRADRVKVKLAEELYEAGVFKGPVGDPNWYIRVDGKTKLLKEVIRDD